MIRKEKLNPRAFKPWLISLTLLAVDLFSITAAFVLAYATRWLLLPIISGVLTPSMVTPGYFIFAFLLVIQLWLSGLYPGLGLTGLYEFRNLIRVTISSIIIAGILIYFLDFAYDISRIVFALTGLFTLLILPGLRLSTHRVGSRYMWWGRPVVLYGSEADAQKLIQYLRSSHRVGLVPQGIVLAPPIQGKLTVFQLPVYQDEREQWQALRARGYEHVIAVENKEMGQKFPMGTLEKLSEFFPTVELVLGDPALNVFSLHLGELNGSPALRNEYYLLKPGILFYKRVFDLFFSFATFLIILPIFLIISVAILIDDGFPILYFQKRMGRHQKLFSIVKFRTMTPGAHLKLRDMLETDDIARAEYEKHHKLLNDPRLTRVGKVIRKFGLDELPQVFNVIKGDMSWIGPRAYMPEELEKIGDSANLIFRANPGLTGWWQVNGRNRLTFEQRLQLDKYYISNFSPIMDLFILYKTIFVLFEGSGA